MWYSAAVLLAQRRRRDPEAQRKGILATITHSRNVLPQLPLLACWRGKAAPVLCSIGTFFPFVSWRLRAIAFKNSRPRLPRCQPSEASCTVTLIWSAFRSPLPACCCRQLLLPVAVSFNALAAQQFLDAGGVNLGRTRGGDVLAL